MSKEISPLVDKLPTDESAGRKLERRTDSAKRHAIAQIEQYLFHTNAEHQIFEALTKCLLTYTESDFIECYALEAENKQAIAIKKMASYGTQNEAMVNTTVLEQWLQLRSILACPVFYNTPLPKASKSILNSAYQKYSLMMLPIIIESKVVAVCVLTSKHNDYKGRVFSEITPIISAASACLRFTHFIRQSNRAGFDFKINEDLASSLILLSPCGILIVDKQDKILFANNKIKTIFSSNKTPDIASINEYLLNVTLSSIIPDYIKFLHWSNQDPITPLENEVYEPKVWKNQRLITQNEDNKVVDLSLFRFNVGSAPLTVIQIVDVSAQKAEEIRNKKQAQEFEALTKLLPVAIIRVNSSYECTFSNEKWYEFTGQDHNEDNSIDWINSIHPKDISVTLHSLRSCLRAGKDHRQELRIITPMGKTKWLDFQSRVIFDQDNNIDGFIGTFSDVTDRHITQKRLRLVAEYDNLTGLANRSLFNDRLRQSFRDSERDKAKIYVFFLDIDGFKQVNDSAGHGVGDELLKLIAKRLQLSLRQNDTVARFGGDEFVVLLGKGAITQSVSTVADKVIKAISLPYYINDKEIRITTSLGIAYGTAKTSNLETILKNADTALYRAKRDGKNNFKMFDNSMDLESRAKLDALEQLRSGVKKHAYHLCFQPIINAQTQAVSGFEALLRFEDNAGKTLSPDVFINVLEESNLIIEVGAWVIENVCRHLRTLQASAVFPEGAYISFNVSAKQLLDKQFISNIKLSCEQNKVNPANLVMEITESSIITSPEDVDGILKELREFGLRTALDDFGTGFSSMAYLQKFPFDMLKIDKSFVIESNQKEKNVKIVKATIALAKSFDLLVCVEGVEDQTASSTMSELGADLLQGYFYSKPMKQQDVIKYLASKVSSD